MAAKNSIGQSVRKRAMSYPHVTEEFPWGESAFKVKGKTFVFMREEKDAGSHEPGHDHGICHGKFADVKKNVGLERDRVFLLRRRVRRFRRGDT